MFSKNRAFTLVEIMIVVLIIGVLLAIATPNFVRARESSRQKACIRNLKVIFAANQEWAMDRKARATAAPPSIASLSGRRRYIRRAPVCPAGGSYSQPDDISGNPTCSYGTTGGNNFSHDMDALASTSQ